MSDAKAFAEVRIEGGYARQYVGGTKITGGFYDHVPELAQAECDKVNAAVASLVAAARKEERAKCAKVADDYTGKPALNSGEFIAAAIRAIGD